MEEKYWLRISVSAGPMGQEGQMWGNPQEWNNLSYDNLIELQGILHEAQGRLLMLSAEKAKAKKHKG